MQWSDLFTAIALVLVFEGILPFLRPSLARAFARRFESISDRGLRVIGLASMLTGIALLSVVR